MTSSFWTSLVISNPSSASLRPKNLGARDARDTSIGHCLPSLDQRTPTGKIYFSSITFVLYNANTSYRLWTLRKQ